MSSFALPLDPYKLLGVSKDAKLPEIRSAHRKLVLKCHPDKVQDAALKAIKQDEFQKVQQAYELLSDDNKRLQYDEQVKLFELRKEMGRGNPTAKSNPFEYEVKSAEPGSRPSSYGRPPPNVYSNSHPPRSHEDIMHRENQHQPKKSASYDSTTDRKRAAEEARLREDAKVRAEYFRKRDEEERDRLLRAREKEREREKRAHNEKKKSRDREKRRGTEEKRSRATGAYVEDDSDDEYSPRSSTKKSDRHKMEEEIRSREAAARAEEAAREAARSQIKEAPMDPKWNEHMDFAGKYMQAARRKGAAEESTFQHPGMRRADTYASPTSREYNLRYATHQYSDDDSPRRSSATRRTSETPPTRRDRSRSRRSPSHPREPAHIVEPASPTPRIPTLQSYNSAPPNLMRDREKPSRSKTQDYPRSQPIPPLPRAQTFQSGDRGYDRDHRSSGLKKELSASDSDSDDHYRSPHHSTSPPRRGAETRYVAEGNRAVPTTTRHRSDMHNLNESYITRDRSESPRGIPRPPLTRNPPSNEARPRTATRTTSYYTPPEAPEPIILTARPKLSREPSMSRSPKYDIPLAHKVQYAPSYGTENVIFTSNRPGPDHYERRREYDHYPSRGVYASG